MDADLRFAAWIAALNHPRDRLRLVAAVDDDARIERHGEVERDAEPGAPAEIIDGVDAVGRWLHRLPPRVTWSLAGEAAALPDGMWRIEYALSVDEFDNGGVWVARFADDGRLLHLSHRPFPLPAKWR